MLLRREAERHARPLVWGAFDTGLAAVQNSHAFDDREPQAGATPISSAIDAMEAVEDARKLVWRNAAAVIRYRYQQHSVAAPMAFQADVPAGTGVGESVFYKIANGPLKKSPIQSGVELCGSRYVEVDMRFAGGGFIEFEDGAELAGDVERLAANLGFRIFGARQK